jgi:hypothetical protein
VHQIDDFDTILTTEEERLKFVMMAKRLLLGTLSGDDMRRIELMQRGERASVLP